MYKRQDSTVTGCQIVSLFAARNAGIPVPDEAFERGLKYMASCRDKKGAYGSVSYTHLMPIMCPSFSIAILAVSSGVWKSGPTSTSKPRSA